MQDLMMMVCNQQKPCPTPMAQVQNTKNPRGMLIKKWCTNNTAAHRSFGQLV